MTPKQALDKVIRLAGGQGAFARALGPPIRQTHVSYWVLHKQSLPGEHCVAAEKIVKGKVKAYELRPDVFKPPRQRRVPA